MNLKETGNNYFSNEQYPLASAMYRRYVEHPHSDNKNAYFNWSMCAFKLEDYPECIRLCNEALKLDSRYLKVYYRLAHAYCLLDD